MQCAKCGTELPRRRRTCPACKAPIRADQRADAANAGPTTSTTDDAIEPSIRLPEAETNEGEADRLRRELAELRRQRAAAAEVLKTISASPADLQAVFASIAQNAVTLCSALFGVIFRYDGALLHLVAEHGLPSDPRQFLRQQYPMTPRGLDRQAVVERQVMHAVDVLSDPRTANLELAHTLGYRSNLTVPMLHGGRVIGLIVVHGVEPKPFSASQIALLETFADQAVIAIENARLFEAEQTRRRELEARSTELQESLEYQTAISNVLDHISRSTGGVSSVLDLIAATARGLCGAERAIIWREVGETLRAAAYAGHADNQIARIAAYEMPKVRGSVVGRSILERRAIHVADIVADPEFQAVQDFNRRQGARTLLSVPLLSNGHALGGITLSRTEVAPFSPQQVALITTFADQAVIAIENARLLDELQNRQRELEARTAELAESLKYQTAISEVLSVISRSGVDLRTVLETVVATAAGLCRAESAGIYRPTNNGAYMLAAGFSGERTYQEREYVTPIRPGNGTLIGRTVMTGETVYIEDALTDPDYEDKDYARIGNIRTLLGVPLLRDGEPIGAFGLARSQVDSFSTREIELVQTFADQAVIAIENARLLDELQTRQRELTESLEYQTATSEVLGVISRSPNELQPVLDAIVATAHKLCQAEYALFLKREDNGLYHIAANSNAKPAFLDWMREHPVTTGDGSAVGIVAFERRTLHLPDALTDARFTDLKRQAQSKARTMLGVPLMHGGEVIGIIFLARTVVQPFTHKQIDLVTTFADQAVIAINNANLFDEVQARTKELARSVEELKSLGEVGQAVSSTLDMGTVLQTILENAARMAFASGGTIYVYDKAADAFHLEAGYNMSEEHIARVKAQPIRMGEPVVGECAQKCAAVQIEDLQQTDVQTPLLQILLRAGVRSILALPLLHQNDVIGALVVRRTYAGAFTPETVRLLEAFAAQSAIAVNNARLFKEVEMKSRELEIASQHKSQFVANMSHELRTPLAAMLGYTELLADGAFGALPEKSVRIVDRVQVNGRHLLGLINTVLDISKIEAGQFSLNLAEYSLTSLIETVRVGTESLASGKSLALVTEISPGLPRGYGDEQRLAQVLLNLVGNAIKFTDQGEVRIIARAEEGQLLVTVRDTGPGIPADEQQRIFEEFHQVDNSSTRAKGGTGLGLAIAKKIVEMHGGSIRVESAPGAGSAFHVRLPVTTPRL